LKTAGRGKTERLSIYEIGCILIGYTDGEWKQEDQFHVLLERNEASKPFKEKMPEFVNFVKKSKEGCDELYIAAHNGKRFDHRVMYFHDLRLSSEPNIIWGDTMEWIKRIVPGLRSYSIANLHPNGAPPAHHNALPDCEAAIRILNHYQVQPCQLFGETWNAIEARCNIKK